MQTVLEILKDAARVGGGFGEDGKGKVAVFSGGIRVHGLLSFERLGVRRIERTASAVRIFKVAVSWLAPVPAPVLRLFQWRRFRLRRE